MIGAELVDVGDGSQIWGAQFSRQLSDILTIQEEISREITEHLRVRLTPAERKRLVRGPKVSASAYQLYLKGRGLSQSAIAECRRKGARFFRAGNYRRPRICAGPSGLADSHAISATVFSRGRARASHPTGRAAAIGRSSWMRPTPKHTRRSRSSSTVSTGTGPERKSSSSGRWP